MCSDKGHHLMCPAAGGCDCWYVELDWASQCADVVPLPTILADQHEQCWGFTGCLHVVVLLVL